MKTLFNHLSNSRKAESFLIIIVLAISFIVTLYCQMPLLTNKYAVNDDVRQGIYGYYRFKDAELFKGDPITDLYLNFNPYGVTIVYFIISFFSNPIDFSKILPFVMCAIAVLYMFKLGKQLRNNITGFFLSVLFIFVSWSREEFEVFGTSNGTDFGIPLLIMFLYYFLKNNTKMAVIILFLQAFFYPPILIICLSVYLLTAAVSCAKGNKPKIKRILFIGSVFLAITIVVSVKYAKKQLELVSLKEMKSMEEFFPGGRKPVFFNSFYERWTNYESGLAMDFPTKWLILASFLLVLALRRNTSFLPGIFRNLIFMSFVLFIAANIVMYKLFGPGRYIRHTLPVFLMAFIALNIDNLLRKIRLRPAGYVLFLSFFLIILLSFAPRLKRYYIVAPYPHLYEFIQTLPKNVLIAGYPALMDNIPTFAKRKAFINEETSDPFYKNLYPLIKKMTYDFFKAYYADSSQGIRDFCKRYNVDYLIVDKFHFSKEYLREGEFYLNPFNEYIADLVANTESFAIMDIPDNKKIFEENNIFVVKTADI